MNNIILCIVDEDRKIIGYLQSPDGFDISKVKEAINSHLDINQFLVKSGCIEVPSEICKD